MQKFVLLRASLVHWSEVA